MARAAPSQRDCPPGSPIPRLEISPGGRPSAGNNRELETGEPFGSGDGRGALARENLEQEVVLLVAHQAAETRGLRDRALGDRTRQRVVGDGMQPVAEQEQPIVGQRGRRPPAQLGRRIRRSSRRSRTRRSGRSDRPATPAGTRSCCTSTPSRSASRAARRLQRGRTDVRAEQLVAPVREQFAQQADRAAGLEGAAEPASREAGHRDVRLRVLVPPTRRSPTGPRSRRTAGRSTPRGGRGRSPRCPSGRQEQLAQPGRVAFGVVLADVELQVGDSARVVLLDGQRSWAEGVSGAAITRIRLQQRRFRARARRARRPPGRRRDRGRSGRRRPRALGGRP